MVRRLWTWIRSLGGSRSKTWLNCDCVEYYCPHILAEAEKRYGSGVDGCGCNEVFLTDEDFIDNLRKRRNEH